MRLWPATQRRRLEKTRYQGSLGHERAFELYQWPLQLTCAQVREVMETMATGSFAKKFQALQQASTISS